MDLLKKYDVYISVGSNCRATAALKNLGVRKYSLPFDWVYSSPRTIYEAYIDDFKQLINCKRSDLEWLSMKNGDENFFPKYGYQIMHGLHKDLRLIHRRARRMQKVFHSNDKILLIYNNVTPVESNHINYIKKMPSEWMDLKYLHKLKLILPDNIDVLAINYGAPKLKEFSNIAYRYTDELDKKRNTNGAVEQACLQSMLKEII